MSTVPTKQVSFLAGASGSGKTTFLLQCLKDWTLGRSILPIQFEAKKCLYLVCDRSMSEIEERLTQLAIPNHGQIHFRHPIHELGLRKRWKRLMNEEQMVEDLERLVESKEYDLLIIDPCAFYMTDKVVSYKDVAASISRLGEIAERRGLTILATHHAAKKRSDFNYARPQDRILGSSAFQGFSGTQMILDQAAERDAASDILTIVHHLHPPESYPLYRDKNGYFTLDESESAKVPGKNGTNSERTEAYLARINKLVNLLTPNKPYQPAEIAEIAVREGMSRASVYRYLKEAIDNGSLTAFEDGRIEREEEE